MDNPRKNWRPGVGLLRIWVEEPSYFGALVICEYCDRSYGPFAEEDEAFRYARQHSVEQHRDNKQRPANVFAEAELVCSEKGCARRWQYRHPISRCAACWQRAGRPSARKARDAA